MKRILISVLMIAVFASAAFAAGPQSPLPVVVRVNQEVVVLATLTNTYTGEVVETYTADDGQTLFELANLQKGYQAGQVFTVKVLGVTKSFTLDSTSPIYFIDIDVNAQLAQKCVVNAYPVYGEVVQNDDGNCQIYIKAPEYVPVKCVAKSELSPGETSYLQSAECDISITTAPADYTLEAILAVLFAGSCSYIIVKRPGRKSVKLRVYNGKKQHSHANYTSWHSPDRMHDYQPHTKGELEPKYSETKNTDGKYNYLG